MSYLNENGLSHLWDKIKSALSGKATFTPTKESNTTNFIIFVSSLVEDGEQCLVPVVVFTSYSDFSYVTAARVKVANGVLDVFRFEPSSTVCLNWSSNTKMDVRMQLLPGSSLVDSLDSSKVSVTQVSGNIYRIFIDYAAVNGASYSQYRYQMQN